MPGNEEEKEKCLEKLNQMQKYLPFIDFMIDKIHKKSSEVSLECQLSKFQVLRSMIAEKSARYSWDVVIKVEEIIEKLITKLDFKDPYEKSKGSVGNASKQKSKSSISAPVCKVPSSGARVATAASSGQKAVASRAPRESSTSVVDAVMKALKASVSSASKSTDKGKELLSNSLGPNQPLEGQSMETDLDKDLDGFDLTDCPSLSDWESSSSAAERVSAAPEKVPSHGDLLSSSREKLLKSLESRLLPCRREQAAPRSAPAGKGESSSDAQSSSAFSRNQTSVSERKSGSDVSEVGEVGAGGDRSGKKGVDVGGKAAGSQKSSKTCAAAEKARSDSESGDANLKQRLKEKLSTDICEVYKVPGKSVGGSLRSLNKAKAHKRGSGAEEEELFKPDRVTETRGGASQSKGSEKRDGQVRKSHHESSTDKKSDKTDKKDSHRRSSACAEKEEKSEKKQEGRGSKSVESKPKGRERSPKEERKPSLRKETEDKSFDVNKLNDEELLEFVKENTQYLPHLAKLKPEELRKAVQSSGSVRLSALEGDSVSEISDDSFGDLEECKGAGGRRQGKGARSPPPNPTQPHPLASVKIAQIGSDGVAKNVKPIVEPSKDVVALEEIGDKTHDTSEGENLDEEDYAQKLIDETTPNVVPQKKKPKKGLLELPLPVVDDFFDDLASLESFEGANSPIEDRDPRLKVYEKKSTVKNKAEPTAQPSADKPLPRSVSNGRTNPLPPKDTTNRPQTHFPPPTAPLDTYRPQQVTQNRPDPWPNKPLPAPQEVTPYHQVVVLFPNEQACQPAGRGSGPYPKLPAKPVYNNARRHSYGSSEPKSYAEYKRMKQKEKSSQPETAVKENAKSTLPVNSETAKSPAERENAVGKTKKVGGPVPQRPKEPFSKQANPQSYQTGTTHEDKRRSQHPGRRFSDHCDRRGKTEESERSGRVGEEKRHSVESEELVSPLEELYRDDSKPKTGRGYGIQNFKIPKKVREFPKPGESQASGVGPPPQGPNTQSEPNAAKETVPAEVEKEAEGSVARTVEETRTKKSEEKPERTSSISGATKAVPATAEPAKTKTDTSIKEPSVSSCDSSGPDAKRLDSTDGTTEPESVTIQPSEGKSSEVREKAEEQDGGGDVEAKDQPVEETAKKCEAQVAECDSSVSEKCAGEEPEEKTAAAAKEEAKFTQKFMEALIRKSFQSGEEKLLLAQAKLFEEFAKKLNSKKLKTIQRIINSETDSSSSSGEMQSEDEKKRKKGKKSEEKVQKGRRGRKRGRKPKRQKSSCSSSEGEDVCAEESCDKKEEKNGTEESKTSESNEIQERTEELERKSESPPAKGNGRMRKKINAESGKDFNGRKAKRKRKQKLLEKILSGAPEEMPAKKPGPRAKRRIRGKAKTELDRLHEDIRNMFLNAGVVTPTGQRMCRLLKQTGGNPNSADGGRESAKTTEEDRPVKVYNRAKGARGSNPNGSEGKSSQEEDPKLASEVRVVLQRVDLNNFGYGEKISEDCVSFRRMRGRNKAIRGGGWRGAGGGGSSAGAGGGSLLRNVLLLRNLRKCRRKRQRSRRRAYRGKGLAEVVKNLPLKMAKMKHLQMCAKVDEGAAKKRKYSPRKSPKKANRRGRADLKLSNAELLNYAFERIRVMYSCKLCSHVTRYITGHYKMAHPEHEVLISRLCVGEAKRAKLDAKRNRYEHPPSDENPLAESMKRKMKILLNIPNLYNCRMCSSVKTMDLEVFKAHVSSHTGECRFQCPAEGCQLETYSHQDIKIHILTKHAKQKFENSKLKELYSIDIEGTRMFGYLCSVCNFVQLCRSNVAEHISRRHAASEGAKIIKINMSANPLRPVKQKCNIKTDVKDLLENESEGEVDVEKLDNDSCVEAEEMVEAKVEESVAEVRRTYGKTRAKRKSSDAGTSEAESHNDEEEERMHEKKKVLLMEVAEEESAEREEETGGRESGGVEGSEGALEQEGMEVDEGEPGEKDVEVEECVDLGRISRLKGSDIIGSVESPERRGGVAAGSRETAEAHQKLKVGPLEARLLENSIVVYECYVKGCLFCTRAFDLFEKHIKISHWKTKWNGVCDVCTAGKEVQPCPENSFKLLTALRHLKLHEREKTSDGKLSNEDLITELKLIDSNQECVLTDEESDKSNGASEEAPEMKKTDTPEPPFPPKPLLRVRNLLGDRLSTPKDSPEESDVLPVGADPTPDAPPNSMFTIENVRSLNDNPPEKSEIQIQHVCSLKDTPAPLQQLTPGKAILVRSCPTRKIAIRPEPSALSIDVGQLSVVQSPTVTHPVVLAPLATASPIRILSSSLSPKSKFAVKPILVSTDPVRVTSPNVLSLISPGLTPVVTSPSVTADPNCMPQPPMLCDSTTPTQFVTSSKELEVTVITPTTVPAPPNKPLPPLKPATPGKAPSPNKATSPGVSSTGLIDLEDGEEKDSITLQRIHSSSNLGNKRVKDAKIYEEMLTKTKLCHLFKCMGIECSFTCNNECVFRQHIGLHDAQRRLKNNKGIRTIYLRLANKTTRAFYWQQCAYCCELLTNTNKALSQHVLEEHGHCMYQCAFCFYRAVSHSYVEIHQNLAHSQVLKTTPRVIYKCKPLRKPPPQNTALEKHGRRQSVRPYHCDQCGRKFFITQDFVKHLTTQHQSVTAYTCHICKNLCFKADRLVVHYKLHSYCTYQCAYCLHGTETEKEMVFHLCNFHFSQPAVMYVRAFADGQSHEVSEKQMGKKKHISNQLESLKVVVYESDTLNADCIVEVDPDEDTPENAPEASSDLSAIVAELGINTDVQQSSCVTPLMKELASIGGKNAKNLTVKTLLPNAQFSSETENGGENCSILISSGLSTPSDQSNEKAMNIPLGQLPLEGVNVKRNETPPSPEPPKNVAPPDKNLKLNELIVNLQNKDKLPGLASSEEGKLPAAIHKLPPVVLSRSAVSKNVYPSKSAIMRKKSEEPIGGSSGVAPSTDSGVKPTVESEERKESTKDSALDAAKDRSTTETVNSSSTKPSGEDGTVTASGEPNDRADLTDSESGKDAKDVCALSGKDGSATPGIVINIQSKINSPSVLKPPIIRVEDFAVGNGEEKSETEVSSSVEKEKEKEEKEKEEGGGGESKQEAARAASPDIVILEEEKSEDIITVTLDSDDDRNESLKGEGEKGSERERKVGEQKDDKIRKEMELLRNQIASETDSLLFDEGDGEKGKEELLLSIETPSGESGESANQSLLSPIEEAICSLNKKLQSETEEAQKKEKEKASEEESPKKAESCSSDVPGRPRTRFSARDKRREGGEAVEKSEGEDFGAKKEDAGKGKRLKEGLMGKELFICGNENCTFAAEDDVALKDHLYVCDLSRETSMLVCPHCSRQTKQFHPYLEHLKYHGLKKYHCGLCDFSSAVDASVSRHVKQKHKCSLVKVLPKDTQPGHFVYYPKNYKVDKVDFEVNGYSPGDEDKLPLQSVYQVNVKCAKCPYFTKVRSNMVRHLKIHVKSVETEGVVVVPSTAPTNPVPCLDTKERMFDKMTNLAASSQLAQAKEKSAIEGLSAEDEAKLPQFVAEQMRYKCCLPDCNYITVDDGMLKHHIKALHDEINYYSCPHCLDTVHVDIRHVTLDKIGHHLKHHDAKLYKCAHCIYFHYQKNVVEKHTVEKHPDRRYFVHTVREPKPGVVSEEEASSNEGGARVWKCGLCEGFRTPSKSAILDHVAKNHNVKSKYRCDLCSVKGNNYHSFVHHFTSKHPGEKVSYTTVYVSENVPTGSLESGNSSGADSSSEHFDTTPLWQRGTPRIRHIRGILIEEEEIKTKKSKRTSVVESEADAGECAMVKENAFCCPLCTNKKKPFYTRNEDCFRTHLYQELNYQQFACILCGKMFVDKKDFDRHHARAHPDKEPAVKQTTEDHEIKFWVDQVIAKRRQQMEERKRKLSDGEASGSQGPVKKKKEV